MPPQIRRTGDDAFSGVTGGLFFALAPLGSVPDLVGSPVSRLVSGGNPWPRAIARGTARGGRTPPQISRRKDQPGRLGTQEKAGAMAQHNYKLVRRFYSYENLKRKLRFLLTDFFGEE